MYLGSFDPVHTAHIDIPCKIKDYYNLRKIIFVHTGKSPLGRRFFASYSDRVNMIKNAIKGHEFFTVSTFENTSENISFTIDTVCYFKKKFENSSLRIIMGEDNFCSLASWHKYTDILSSVNIIVLSRDNIERYDKINTLKNYIEENINLFNQTKSGKIHFSALHKSDISATALRMMIKQNESFKNFVSKENYEYIEKNGLYK